ncbi:MAG: c(7)-type cytochrome triheme domain-containing protein [Thermodesulfobacteriota bacterium]
MKNILLGALGTIFCLGCVTASLASAPKKGGETVIHSHGDTQIIAEKPTREMFSHALHFGQLDLSCDSCHPDTFQKKRGAAKAKGDYTMKAFAEGKYCGTCHDGDTAFSANSQCSSCHIAPEKENMYFNKPAKTVEFGHKAHIDMGLECEQCHNEKGFEMRSGAAEEHPESFTMQALYDGKYCGSCHNGDDAFASNTRCTVCHIGVKGFDRLNGGDSGAAGHGGGH